MTNDTADSLPRGIYFSLILLLQPATLSSRLFHRGTIRTPLYSGPGVGDNVPTGQCARDYVLGDVSGFEFISVYNLPEGADFVFQLVTIPSVVIYY